MGSALSNVSLNLNFLRATSVFFYSVCALREAHGDSIVTNTFGLNQCVCPKNLQQTNMPTFVIVLAFLEKSVGKIPGAIEDFVNLI